MRQDWKNGWGKSSKDNKVGRKSCGKWILAAGIFMLFLTQFTGISQDDKRRRRGEKQVFNQAVAYNKDSIGPLSDSLLALRDSIHRADSLFKIDSAALQKQSSLSAPAFTEGKDSVIEVFSDGQRKVYYYGDVSVKYGNMTLSADFMEYNMSTGVVYARGTLDTLTGEVKGMPKMTQGKDTYQMEEVWYNFNTKKAKISNMVTQQEEGLLQGKNIKMMPDRSINITNGTYTVCDLEDPHYFLHLTSARVITKPSQKIVFGPALPYFEGVPLPIVLPFGFVPQRPKRATGLLMPSFGEETARGFYLKDLGMYFVFGDHFDLSMTGDIYSLGSWSVDINSRYKVNYKFTGNFGFTYSNDQTGEKGSSDFFQTKNMALKWSHSQDSKSHPGTTFSASVNFSSPQNNKYNSRSVTQALENQASSSISWSRNWNGKFNLSINGLHSQNTRDSSYTFTLPNLTFSVTRFYPFKQKNRVGKEKFYEKFSLGYNTTLQNKIGFKMTALNNYDQSLYSSKADYLMNQMQNGMTHNFQIGLPDFTLFNYLNFTPGITYGMNWFFKQREYSYDQESGQLVYNDTKQFSSFGMTQTYSGSISMSTRIYGTFNFGQSHKIQAIRHVISPSMSMSLSPELGTRANGWRTLTYSPTTGVEQTYDYNIYSGQLYSAPGKGKSATASISIGNNIEAKVRDLRDTTGKGVKKVKLIDQLNFNTGYNFLADSLNMNTVGVTMSTSVFGKLSISANANMDPYAMGINKSGNVVKMNRFNFIDKGLGSPLRLTNATASLSYSFSGKGHIDGNDGSKTRTSSGRGGGEESSGGGERGEGQSRRGGGGDSSSSAADYYKRYYYHPVTNEYIPGGWLYYTNPDVPWSVNLNYSFNLARNYLNINNAIVTSNKYTQTLGVSGNVKLSPKMTMNVTSGLDIMAFKMTTTQLSFQYDLHCFNISASWVPTGTWQSWSFRIAANASALSDLLKYKKSTSYWDN